MMKKGETAGTPTVGDKTRTKENQKKKTNKTKEK